MYAHTLPFGTLSHLCPRKRTKTTPRKTMTLPLITHLIQNRRKMAKMPLFPCHGGAARPSLASWLNKELQHPLLRMEMKRLSNAAGHQCKLFCSINPHTSAWMNRAASHTRHLEKGSPRNKTPLRVNRQSFVGFRGCRTPIF